MDGDGGFQSMVRASTIGALSICVLGTPLDVARQSAQAALAPRQSTSGLVEALRAAAKPGIVKGCWRGLSPALARTALSPVSFMLAYEQRRYGGRTALEAGIFAKVVQTIALQPLELLRTSRQATALLPTSPPHLDRTMRQVLYEDGLGSLWRGLTVTLLRDVPFAGVFWTTYMGLHENVGLGMQDGNSAFLAAAGFGSVSAGFAAVLTQPMDVLKTKIQVHQLVQSTEEGYRLHKPARFFATLRSVYKMAGFRGFWTGCLARALCAGIGGFLLGPLYESAQLIAADSARPTRKPYILPEDPIHTIVHPRSQKAMFIDVR